MPGSRVHRHPDGALIPPVASNWSSVDVLVATDVAIEPRVSEFAAALSSGAILDDYDSIRDAVTDWIAMASVTSDATPEGLPGHAPVATAVVVVFPRPSSR